MSKYDRMSEREISNEIVSSISMAGKRTLLICGMEAVPSNESAIRRELERLLKELRKPMKPPLAERR